MFFLGEYFRSVKLSEAEKSVERQALCQAYEGRWIQEFNECESMISTSGISQDVCEANGGAYSSCASACRHGEELYPCLTVCIKVCAWE